MALARKWHSVVDIPLADTSSANAIYGSALLALKRCLRGNFSAGGVVGHTGLPPIPWVLEYSSNGTVANANDNWASVSDLVYSAGSAVARSWLAMRSPSGAKRFILDYRGATSNATTHGLVLATKDPISNVGSLTTTVAPAAATLLDTGNATSVLIFKASATGVHRAAFIQCSAGEHWMFIVYKPGAYPAATPIAAFGIWPIDVREGVEMDYPWALVSPLGTIALTDAVSGLVTINANKWPLAIYTPGENTPSSACIAANVTGTSNVFQSLDGVSAFTGRFDEVQTPVVPTTASVRNVVGRLEDIGLVHINAQGSVTPAEGPIERAVIGNWLIPMASAPVF